MSDELTSLEKQEFALGVHEDDANKVFKEWSRDTAQRLAREMKLSLTDKHWQVIEFLRLHYANTGPAKHAREITQVINERFVAEGGSRFLYDLFPQGPVSAGCRLAGVPVPRDAQDAHFGSVQ